MSAVPVEEISTQARQVRFSDVAARAVRGIAEAIAFVFFALGWSTGALWKAVVFAILMIRYGFRQGAGRVSEETSPPPQ